MMVMETQFNPVWVTFSILVGIFASYVALNLAQNITDTKGRARILWLSSGALAMGIGIWSMHFIGMVAFEMPGMDMAYDVPLMILSVIVAIGASALALFIVSLPGVPSYKSIFLGGVAMAAAIAGMHYIGMASMRMAAIIQWNYYLVALSILIALGASFGALFILFQLRNKTEHIWILLAASVAMGIAISGMHYTGMLAATYVHSETDGIKDSNLLVSTNLATMVFTTTLFILGLALIGSLGQRLWSTRTRHVEEVLGESEEKFRRLVEAVKDYAIFILDLEGYITTWNSGAERISGYKEEEVIGKHISVLYTQKDIDNQTALKELVTAREIGHFEGEGQRIRKDGSTYWASIVLTPLFDSQGNITGFSKVIRDITQVKETESRMRHINEELEERVRLRTRDLEERESQLRAIADAVPVLIAQVDQNEQVRFANEAFYSWFQHDRIIGRTLKEILTPDHYEQSGPCYKRVLRGETVSYEHESRSGIKTATFAVTLVPEFDSKRSVTGFIIVGSDISKHKEIQAELSSAKEAAEVANATKSAFLANMSHEIRTPLGAVLGFSELLLHDELSSSERINSFEIIKRNGQLLSNIINDILDLSKVESGKIDIEKLEVPFSDIMKEISSVLNLEAAEKGLELKVTTVGTLPAKITTDPLRLRQVLFNIVGNAIKFTQKGSVGIRVQLIPNTTDGLTKLAFVVTDTGEGIRPDQVDRLFKPFTQADVSTTRKFGGTGLGLVLSRKLAQALGGDVVLTSTTPGKGSTFTITIDPGISEQIIFRGNETLFQTWRPAMPEPKVKLGPLKILVVDDSPDNQILIKKILRLAGATVETADNGKEGVKKALNGDFHLILMDLQMPEMDGYEATRLLREQGYKKPIIALTAHAMKEDQERSLRSGFNDHITKPIDNVALVKTLSEYSA